MIGRARSVVASRDRLVGPVMVSNFPDMWDEPYLETCCRAALHRLKLSGGLGRPDGLKDGPCLHRLSGMGLAMRRRDGSYTLTDAGARRHAIEVLVRKPVD